MDDTGAARRPGTAKPTPNIPARNLSRNTRNGRRYVIYALKGPSDLGSFGVSRLRKVRTVGQTQPGFSTKSAKG